MDPSRAKTTRAKGPSARRLTHLLTIGMLALQHTVPQAGFLHGLGSAAEIQPQRHLAARCRSATGDSPHSTRPDVVQSTRAWLREFVAGEGLCPWALASEAVILHSGHGPDSLQRCVADVLSAGRRLRAWTDGTKVPTTLTVFSHEDFSGRSGLKQFGKLWSEVATAVSKEALDLLAFHPLREDQGPGCRSSPLDPGHYTTRAPWPTLQLLRKEDLERARKEWNERNKESGPGAYGLLLRNKAHLRAMGNAELAARFASLRTGADEEKRFTPTEVWFPEDDAEAARRVVAVYQVAAGTKHSVALTTTGSVFTWGHGGHGRLGLGQAKVRGQNSYSAEFRPRLVTGLQGANVTYVAAGEAHTAAVDELGGLYTWGQGAFGRCGHGVGTDMPSPARVESLSGVSMSQVALGLMHSVAMSVKGQLYTWGKGAATGFDVGEVIPTPRQVKLESRDPVYQIAAGPLHTVVLMQKGDILCFGSGTEGRLPLRDYDESLVDFPLPTIFKPPELKWKGWAAEKSIQASQSQNRAASWWPSRMCCGSGSSAILTGTGEVPAGGMPHENLWLWGTKEIAAVGDRTDLEAMMEDDGTMQTIDKGGNCWLPVPLKTGVRNRTVRSVAMGYEHCLIVTADSLMYSWGNGSKGQLGTGSMMPADTPQFITSPTDVLHVAAGEEHSACLIEGGACFTWGHAAGGRLGLGSCLSDGEQLIPKRVVIAATELRVIRGVNCGSQHSALVTQDGKLLTFGTGWFGRLGHGDVKNEYVPALVPMSSHVKEVHCAMYHTCIVDSKDQLWVCGRDSSLCRDGQKHVLSPILFEPFQQEGEVRCVRSLAACEQHTLVATYRQDNPDDTELWVWGKNDRGQLGLPNASPVIDMYSKGRLHIPGYLSVFPVPNAFGLSCSGEFGHISRDCRALGRKSAETSSEGGVIAEIHVASSMKEAEADC
ncbi:UVR8 [Symbiodinium natans]|uniref:UVR8 protein n=1 Tax=Symbiodinium natans TaxID=878477 RepID=A0A812QUS4_9DINO|nr:UVR8 [Symbiodinium natans]